MNGLHSVPHFIIIVVYQFRISSCISVWLENYCNGICFIHQNANKPIKYSHVHKRNVLLILFVCITKTRRKHYLLYEYLFLLLLRPNFFHIIPFCLNVPLH